MRRLFVVLLLAALPVSAMLSARCTRAQSVGVAKAAPDHLLELAQANDPTQVALAQQWRAQAEHGNAVGQYELGICYWSGGGVQRDITEAVKWLKRSAEQNFTPAQVQLANMYEYGKGVPVNKAEALRYYALAAAHGDFVSSQKVAQLTGVAPTPVPTTVANIRPEDGFLHLPLTRSGGVLTVSAVINGTVSTQFVVDSGASEVSVPETVIALLQKSGKLSEGDFIGSSKKVLADGSSITTRVFIIKFLQVAGIPIYNVRASVTPGNAMPLLGQSYLQRFRSWSIDNSKPALIISAGTPSPAPPAAALKGR